MSTDYAALFQNHVQRRIAQLQPIICTQEFVRSPRHQAQALRLLDYAMATLADWGDLSVLMLAMAPAMEKAGYRDSWRDYLVRLFEWAKCQHRSAIMGELAHIVGVLYLRQAQYVQAEDWLTISLESCLTSHDHHGQSKALNQLAYIAYLKHQYNNAEELTSRAFVLAGSDPLLQAMTYFIKGIIAAAFEQWADAEMLHSQALRLRRISGDQRRIGWSLLDLANVLRRQKRLAEAIQYYLECAQIFDELADRHSWANVQMSIGIAYYDCNQIEDAIGCYLQAKPIWESTLDLLYLAKLHTNLGIAYLAQKNFALAEAAFSDSIHIYQGLHDKAGELNALDGLAMVLLEQQRYHEVIDRLIGGMQQLPTISHLPIYNYLISSMQNHLAQAESSR